MDTAAHYFNALVYEIALPNIRTAIPMVVLGLALEWLLPLSTQPSLASRIRGTAFWAGYIVLGGVAARAVNKLVLMIGWPTPAFRVDIAWLVASDNWALWLVGMCLAPFVPAMLYDLFYYWFHRLQHSVPFLWRFHRLHHAIQELSILNSYHHPLEMAFRIPLMALPMGFLVEATAPQFAVVSMLIASFGMVQHSATTCSFGPLRYLLCEPKFHRIHHSMEERHWNNNFGFSSPLWDMLFGTAYFPGRTEYPATGLPDLAEAHTLGDFLLPPPATSGDKTGLALVQDAGGKAKD